MSYSDSDSDSDDELFNRNLHVIQKQKKAQPKLAINSLTKSRHMTDYGMPGAHEMHTFDTDLVTKKRASLQAIPMNHPPGATVPRTGSPVIISAKDLYIKKHQGEMSMFNRRLPRPLEYSCIRSNYPGVQILPSYMMLPEHRKVAAKAEQDCQKYHKGVKYGMI
jgi:hypothetical protein